MLGRKMQNNQRSVQKAHAVHEGDSPCYRIAAIMYRRSLANPRKASSFCKVSLRVTRGDVESIVHESATQCAEAPRINHIS